MPGKDLKLAADTPRRNLVPLPVGEHKPGPDAAQGQPGQHFPAELFREINAPHLASLGIQVHAANLYVLRLNLHQLADPGAVAPKNRTTKYQNMLPSRFRQRFRRS